MSGSGSALRSSLPLPFNGSCGKGDHRTRHHVFEEGSSAMRARIAATSRSGWVTVDVRHQGARRWGSPWRSPLLHVLRLRQQQRFDLAEIDAKATIWT